MEQTIRFCRSSDGVRIAYAAVGAGRPLVKAANWLTHLEFDWQSPVWEHWLRELSRDHLYVRYDQRGCGLSDRDVDDLSSETWVRDLEAVDSAAIAALAVPNGRESAARRQIPKEGEGRNEAQFFGDLRRIGGMAVWPRSGESQPQ